MKIVSKFKDYYDYIANIYGGGDPKILYLRSPIAKNKCEIDIGTKKAFRIYDTNFNAQHYVIVVAGKGYYVRAERATQYDNFGDFKILTKENFPKFYERPSNIPSWYPHREPKESNYIGFENELFTFIARKINQPVFRINRFTQTNKNVSVFVDSNIPILQDYGLSSIISPEQIYQDISYYLCNTMHESPDVRVPNILSDKEKVLQYGFDAKQSFRHRK